MSDRNIAKKLRDKAIKPVVLYGAECWAVRNKDERKLYTTEMRLYPMAAFLIEKRLRWLGHIQR